MKPAIVIWGDSYEEHGETDLRDWTHAPYTTHACGWIFKDTDDGVSLCQEWWPGSPNMARAVTFIPRAMIITVKYLEQ